MAAWMDTAKAAYEIAKTVNNAELLHLLADMKVLYAEQVEKTLKLKTENAELSERLKLRKEMSFDRNVYWQAGEGGARVGPFCPKCLDGENKASRMATLERDSTWRCPVCEYVQWMVEPNSPGWETPGPPDGY